MRTIPNSAFITDSVIQACLSSLTVEATSVTSRFMFWRLKFIFAKNIANVRCFEPATGGRGDSEDMAWHRSQASKVTKFNFTQTVHRV